MEGNVQQLIQEAQTFTLSHENKISSLKEASTIILVHQPKELQIFP